MDDLYWLNIGATVAIQAVSYGVILTASIYTTYLMERMNRSYHEINFIFGMQYTVFLSIGIFDTIRNLVGISPIPKPIVWIFGILVWFLGYVLSIFFVTDYDAFFGFVASFSGIGSGILYWSSSECYMCLSEGKPKNTYATGLVSLSSAVFLWFYPYYVGPKAIWEYELRGFVFYGTIILIISVCISMYVLAEARHLQSVNDRNQDYSLAGSRYKNDDNDITATITITTKELTLKQYITRSLFFLGMTLYQSLYYVPFSNLSYQMQLANYDIPSVRYVTASLGASSCIGKLLCMCIVTKYPRLKKPIFIASSLLITISIIIWLYATNYSDFVAFAFIYGFATGSKSSLVFQILSELSHDGDDDHHHQNGIASHKKRNSIDDRTNENAPLLNGLSLSLTIGNLISTLVGRYQLETINDAINYSVGVSCVFNVVFIMFYLIHLYM